MVSISFIKTLLDRSHLEMTYDSLAIVGLNGVLLSLDHFFSFERRLIKNIPAP